MNSEKFTIAIVEDEEALLGVLQKKLEFEGYNVLTARDGEEGIRIIKENKPDLILLDILMPKIDGYGVLEAIKEDDSTKDIPVIVVSNSGQPVEIKKILDLGAQDYLVKADFTPEDVMHKVKTTLGEEYSASEGAVGTDNSAVSTVQTSGGKYKVLLVEDDKFLGELSSNKLAKDGFDVTLAIDGESGLQKAKTGDFDIILLDIRLPGMDGFEVLTKLKNDSDPKVSQVPVVVMSNFGQEDYINKARSLGAQDYLVKANFTTDEIAGKIEEILEK